MSSVLHDSYRFVLTIRYGAGGAPTAPWALESALHDRPSRAVSVRELNRGTSSILASLEDGERILVTKHLEPIAVLLSVRDTLCLLAMASLVGQPPQDPEAVWDRLRHMARRDLWTLRQELHPSNRRAGTNGFWTPSGRWLAIYSDSDPDPDPGPWDAFAGLVDLLSGPELERLLVGEGLWAARDAQDRGRLNHGRVGPRRPLRPPAKRAPAG